MASPEEIKAGYHQWYYDTKVWERVRFLGIPCLKSVSDLWNYQEIIAETKPSLIVEYGTHGGGSTLFFAVMRRNLGGTFRVLSVDIDHTRVPQQVSADPDIELMTQSTTDPETLQRIRALRAQFPGPLFAILDSDHREAHVYRELETLSPLLQQGDYVIVEDGNINGHPVLPDWGPGPYEAVHAFEQRHPGIFTHDREREEKFGFTFAPNGFLIRN